MTRTKAGWLGAIALGVTLMGCGSGGGAGSTGPAVSGVASPGGPVTGTVSLKDSSSPAVVRTTSTAADGSFSIATAGLSGPFLLRVEWAGGQAFSLTEAPGTADINPITDLAVRGAMTSGDANSEFEGEGGGGGGGGGGEDGEQSSAHHVTALLSQLRTVLAPLFDLYHVTDPRTDRAAVRALLRDVSFTLSHGVVTVTNRATGGVIFTGPLSDLASGTFNAANLPAGPGTPGPTGDGVALYQANCAGCHGPLATSSVLGASLREIQGAIAENEGGMGALSGLSTGQLTSIASALAGGTGTTTTPPPVTDGPTLYATYCASCHGPLATSAKLGRTAAQIQAAIAANTGGMGGLSVLSSTQVAAIATALATTGGTTTPSAIDGAALYAQYCSGCHGSSKKGRPTSAIQSAIASNTGGMGSLSFLTAAQIAAISAAP